METMAHKLVRVAVLFGLFFAATVKSQSSTGKTGPCIDELSWSTSSSVCDDNGDYEPKQCDVSGGDCWCVDLCGKEVAGTRGPTEDVQCRPAVPPCEKAYKLLRVGSLRQGALRPRCRPDGFYYHTQCAAGSCFCVDRCGNEVPETRHPVTRIRERICACASDSHAYNCPTNPCQGAICRDVPEASCRPSICGGCIPEFTLNDIVVDCGPPGCTDNDGTTHAVGSSWNVDACLSCECLDIGGGVPACLTPSCAGPPRPDCVEDIQPGVCCSTWICPNDCVIVCPRIYRPVCGSDGNTHSNECEMGRVACEQNIEITPVFDGPCDETRPGPPHPQVRACTFNCTSDYQPVCGSDGDTYLNECEMNRVACEQNIDIIMDSIGRCISACNITCNSNYEPVCGSDGQTYPNECSMKEESCENNREITKDHNGECESGLPLYIPAPACNDICPDYNEPICGSDGDTYSNECKMTVASCLKNIDITIAKKGPCDSLATAGECPPVDEGVIGICANVCVSDNECGSGEKCCPMACGGTVCLTPISSECVDKTGNTVGDGESFRPIDSCVDCLCLNGRKVCPVVDCPPPPPDVTCLPKWEEGACCPKYDCTITTECVDKTGNTVGDGESFRPIDSCVDCLCLNGRKVCPVVDCPPPPPDVTCLPKWDEGACCPKYDCNTPTEACTDRDGNLKVEGDSWEEPCGTCFCTNGKASCPQVKCQGPPNPLCVEDIDPNACCPTYTCPSEGCFDREGKERQEGDRWIMPCGECVCENGLVARCPVRSCELPPSPNCVAKDDPDLCCPSYICPEAINCQTQVSEAGPPIPGKYIPQCKEAGEFMKMQCHGSIGHCWCVDENGLELQGTRRGPGEGLPNCEPTECQTQVSNAGPLIPGKYIPQCTEAGEFMKMQCHGSIGHCWCVDENGVELDGTRRIRGEGPPVCDLPLESLEHPGECPPTVGEGGFGICANLCPDDSACGASEKCCPTACGGSSCMEALQVQPPEPLGNPGLCPATEGEGGFGICSFLCQDDSVCSETQKCCPTACGGSSCMEAIQVQPTATECQTQVSNAGPLIPGKYIPQCTEAGEFMKMQCHGSIGHCWCVDENGVELTGTRRVRGEERPVCDLPPEPLGNPGVCPPTEGEGGFGICANLCADDIVCGAAQKCCPTACGGSSCMEAIQVQPTEGCTDRDGKSRAIGDRWEEPCGICVCDNGQVICPTPVCDPPPNQLCLAKEDPDACCPQYICPEVCVDESGKIYAEGAEVIKSGLCEQVCTCISGSLQCPTVECLPKPDRVECRYITSNKETCCPEWICEEEGCVDKYGTSKAEGERWQEPCGECFCENGNSICPVPGCAPPPSDACAVNEDPDSCCPIYDCPDEGCTDRFGITRAEGATWQDPCGDCVCANGRAICPTPLCAPKPDPRCTINEDPRACCPTYNCPGDGCRDKYGNPKKNRDRWQEPCGECVCLDGQSICPVASCAGPPHPLCTVQNDVDSCCPTFQCPEGCVDPASGIRYDTGKEWKVNACTTCSCPPGEGLRQRVVCFDEVCDAPPSPLCVVGEPAKGECCPSFTCPDEQTVLEGECPPVDPKGLNICGNLCESDASCLSKQKCCPNACGGSSCVEPIQVEPEKQLSVEPPIQPVVIDPGVGKCAFGCTRELRPVCDTEGTTHSNLCEMNRAGCEQDTKLVVDYEGECIVSAVTLECPTVNTAGAGVGICANLCETDGSCGTAQKCCPNGCGGRECVDAVPASELKDHCVDFYQNKHKVGDTYLSTDGCNQCSCGERVEACTLKLCLPPGPCNPDPCQNGGVCRVRLRRFFTCGCTPGYTGRVCDTKVCRDDFGTVYQEGSSIKAREDCATCTCQNGEIVCPELNCPSLPSLQSSRDINGVICNSGGGILPGCCEPIDCNIECSSPSNVRCAANPCDVTSCPSNPDALCLPSYCGECRAVFFDLSGNKVDCKQDSGPSPVESGPCFPNPCINGGTCTARLLFFYQCSCPPGFSGSRCDIIVCPPGVPEVTCFENPCQVTSCTGYPNARCQVSFCGTCKALYYDDNGVEVDCTQAPEALSHPGECPPTVGEGGFGICANLCEDDSVCGAAEKCCPTACGGSSCIEAIQVQPPGCTDHKGNAKVEGDKWPGQCGECVCHNSISVCPVADCRPPPHVNCRVKPDPDACCPVYICGPADCPPDSPVVACAKDPCVVNSCAANPSARCEANYCGGCNAVFYDENDLEIDCSVAIAPRIGLGQPSPDVSGSGQCPVVEGELSFGICANTCSNDGDCNVAGQKCCQTACGGMACMETVPEVPPEPLGNPGECPPTEGEGGFGICGYLCQDDSVCDATEKCCPTACGGSSCMEAIQVQPLVTKCQLKVNEAGSPLPGKYIPQCTEAGEFEQVQCHGSIGHCWCVNDLGDEIAGTRRRPGEGEPACDVPPEPLGHPGECPPTAGEGGFGICAYICQDDSVCGETQKCCPTACGGSSCMEAVQIQPPGATECQTQVAEAGLPLPGKFIPQCTEAGEFVQIQCHGSIGHCWCVDENGVEMQGTRRVRGEGRPVCDQGCTDRDGNSKAEGERWNEPCGECICSNGNAICPVASCAGPPHETCTIIEDPNSCCPTFSCPEGCPDGDKFRRVGDVWNQNPCITCSCERPTNAQPGKTIYPVNCQLEACPQYQLSPGCSYVPPKEDQCCGSLRCIDENAQCPPESPQVYCFVSPCEVSSCPADPTAICLTNYCGGCNAIYYDRSGNEIDCFATATKCQLDVHEAGPPLPGKYIPQCTEAGEFEQVQCHGSIGHCWCVNDLGDEIAGTRRRPGEGEPACGVPPGPLEHPGECPQSVGEGGFGICANLCSDDSVCGATEKCCSTFCGGSSCIEAIQVQPAATKCQLTVHEAGPPLPGKYIPQCTEAGEFEQVQCHGSIGHCWCVNDLGDEIAGTRRRPGEGEPACDVPPGPLEHPGECPQSVGEGGFGICANLCSDDSVCGATEKCCSTFCGGSSCIEAIQVQPAATECQTQVSNAGPLIPGKYIPQCTEAGEFMKMQCHGSIGHCWCVDENGVELTGTRRVRGEERPVCDLPPGPLEHPGECPLSVGEGGFGICANLCSDDSVCDATEKCCSTFCGGSSCIEAIQVQPPEPLGNPGLCPATEGEGGFGICSFLCQDDSVCSETQKCCPTACGGSSCVEALRNATQPPPATECQTQLANAGPLIPGKYIPQCTEAGEFVQIQCHGSIGHCWCVDENGVEMQGTRRVRGEGRPVCNQGCTDRHGNTKTDGDRWQGKCGEFICTNGVAICPVASCGPPPSPFCTMKPDPDACCPEFTCPEGCPDGDKLRQVGELWNLDLCITCSCERPPGTRSGETIYPVNCQSEACPQYQLAPGCSYVPPKEDQCCGSLRCVDENAECPPEAPEVNCIRDPCQGTTCPSNPSATCLANYCGGCNALFFDRSGNIVDCSAPVSAVCPPEAPQVACAVDPCQSASCPSDPSATCRANYCGSCNAVFYDANENEVDCTTLSADDCIDKDGNHVRDGELYRPSGACMDCQCILGQPNCPVVDCFYPENYSFCTIDESSRDECCPRYICPEGCIDNGPLRQFDEQFEDGCDTCTCDRSGVTICITKPCPALDSAPEGCTSIVIPPPPGKCCPEQLIDCPSIFIEEPVNAYVVRHSQPVTLSCSADVPRENLSFDCNGQVMDVGRITYDEQVGRTDASIDITRLEIEDHIGDDKFWCQCIGITDDQQMHRSDKAYVAISFIRKTFEQSPTSEQVQLGQSVTLNCDPPIGVPTPIVTWEKDGQLLDLSVNNSPYSFNEDGTRLTISDVQNDQLGSYSCVAQNDAKRRTSSAATISLI